MVYRLVARIGDGDLDIPVLFDHADHALAGAATILARYPDVELKLYQDQELVLGETALRRAIAARPELWSDDRPRPR